MSIALKLDENLHTKTLPKSGVFEVTQDFHFWHPWTGNQKVPVGFKTNFASIPRPAKIIFDVNGRHREEACIHDFLYSKRGRLKNKLLSRKRCDKIFFHFLKNDNINFFTRHSFYTAVRAGGGIHTFFTSGKPW